MTWPFASYEKQRLSVQTLHSSARKNEQALPSGAVLLGILQAIETELHKRELLGTAAPKATPLWFLAETERNVFLWRNGKSISDSKEFSFWINIRALVLKRRGQLARTSGFNPFVNLAPDSGGIEYEQSYLDAVEALTETFFAQAEALSHASESIHRELTNGTPLRPVVLLPQSQPQLSTHSSDES